MSDHCFGIGLGPSRLQAIYSTNEESVHWQLYASRGLNELKMVSH